MLYFAGVNGVREAQYMAAGVSHFGVAGVGGMLTLASSDFGCIY